MHPASPPTDLLRTWYASALSACRPLPLVTEAMASAVKAGEPVAVLAIGKAARAMMHGAEAAAARQGGTIGECLQVTTQALARDGAIAGDHPVAGAASCMAAEAVADFVASLPPDRPVHVLLSGGASALIGAPVPGLPAETYHTLMRALVTSGLAIDRINAVRARLSRWGGGRLAQALGARPLSVWVLSDVPGDDAAVVGSGPCHPAPPWREALPEEEDALARLASLGGPWWPRLIPGDMSHTPLPATTTVVGNNATARAGLAAAAGALGIPQRPLLTAVAGEAAEAGRSIAMEAMRQAAEWVTHRDQLIEEGLHHRVRPVLLVGGGETTVTIGAAAGHGGRSQELALAAAAMLDIAPHPITLLAAGTDGIDGPTDAAGAIVDQTTWSAIAAAGLDADRALRNHDSYVALDRVGALLRPGPTGSNVMDLVGVLIGHFPTPD